MVLESLVCCVKVPAVMVLPAPSQPVLVSALPTFSLPRSSRGKNWLCWVVIESGALWRDNNARWVSSVAAASPLWPSLWSAGSTLCLSGPLCGIIPICLLPCSAFPILRWQCQLPWLYQVSAFCGPRPALMPAVWAPQVFAQSLSGLVTVSCETSLPCHVWNLRFSPKLSVLCHSVLPVSLIWKDLLDVVFFYFIPVCRLKCQSEHWVFHRYVHTYSPGWCIIPFLLCVVLISFCMCVCTYHVCRVFLAVLISFCMCVYTYHVCRVRLTAVDCSWRPHYWRAIWEILDLYGNLFISSSQTLRCIGQHLCWKCLCFS